MHIVVNSTEETITQGAIQKVTLGPMLQLALCPTSLALTWGTNRYPTLALALLG